MFIKYTSYLVLNYVDKDYKNVEQVHKKSCPTSVWAYYFEALGETIKNPQLI